MIKTKKLIKTTLYSLLSIFFLEIFSELNYLFETIFAKGNKLELAKCADLSKEENVIALDNKLEQKNRETWEKKSHTTTCYIKGYKNTPIFCKIYNQNKFANKWVIIMHGYGGYGSTMTYAAQKFYLKGYNVIVPDLRAHGKSGGKYIGLGYLDSFDLSNIIDLVVKGNQNAEITLFFFFLGASTIIQTSARKHIKNIKALISDCSFDSATNIISYEIKHNFNLPAFPIICFLKLFCKLKAKYNLSLSSPIKEVANIKVPTLFIHGSKDSLVPTDIVYSLYKNANCKKDLLIVDNAGHGISALVNSKLYWSTVFNFLSNL